MQNNSIPKSNKAKCPYCGDASTNHSFSYFNDLVNIIIEPYIRFSIKSTPNFIKRIADFLLDLLLKIFTFLGIVTFGEDIEKSVSFRSRVAWEEAKKRGLKVEQILIFKKPTEHFRVLVGNKYVFFESLPIPPNLREKNYENWDSKYFLKQRLSKEGIPVPDFQKISFFNRYNLNDIFNKFKKPIIVKPASGSRGRHTTTNIHTFDEFKNAINIARKLSPTLITEEHLSGYVCRATLVGGKLAGFYRAESPYVIGDGVKKIQELIKDKDLNRHEKVSAVHISRELIETISRFGFTLDSIIPEGQKLYLYHRTGRFFGGHTKEMLNELHPSFVPILEKAAKITNLPVLGFDVIVPDPSKLESEQRWGIIECNTLPYIDLHYYALEGNPSNVAGHIWDLWNL